MTYQEIKDRLTKCESTLESLKNGSYSNIQPAEVQKTVKQLKVLQESLQSQLAEASKKTYLVTPKSGETSALSLDDKEVDALEDADDIEGIKGADGSEVKEMSDDEFAQAQQNQRLEDHPEKDMIKKIQALIAKEKKIKEGEGASEEEEVTFHKKLDTLVHNTFGKRPEEEMNEAPEGVHYIKVDSSELQEALQILEAAFFNDEHIKFELNDPNVIYIKGAEESDIHDAYEELQQNGIIVDETSIGVELQEDETPEGGMDQGGDLDIGHQDDEPNMLKKDLYDIATYAAKLYKQLNKYDQHDGEVDFPHWWQKKVTLSREYLSSAQHYLEAEEKQPALDQLALERVVKDNESPSLKAKIAAEDFMNQYRKAFRLVSNNFGKEAEAEFKSIIKAKFAQLQEGELNEMVDPSYADMLAQFIILMGSGYGALQAVKKLGDETGDISLDSVKKAIQKHKGQKNEEVGGQSISDLKPGDKFEYNDKTYTLVKHKEGNIATVILPNGDTSTVSFGGKINTGKKAGIGPDYFGQGKGHHIDEASLAKIQKAHSLVVAKMKELAQHYKTGDTSVVPQLKDLTAKKKELERQLDDKVAGTGRDQELSIQEAESTCCGKCGRKHVKGTKCKTPYLKGKDHCRTR